MATDFIRLIEETQRRDDLPAFNPGDTISVHVRVREGEKERLQQYQGVVIAIRGSGNSRTFIVRKMSGNVGVERIFPMNTPTIAKIDVLQRGQVRRAKLFYLRQLRGKAARIKQKRRDAK